MSTRRTKKQKNAARKRRSSTIADHNRKGSELLSPFGGLPKLKSVSWFKEMMPDFLWICFHLNREMGMELAFIGKVLDTVSEVLDEVLGTTPESRPTLDGSLSSWELIPDSARPHVLDRLGAEGAYKFAFPEDFAHVLGMYPGAPGRWVLGPWIDDADFSIDPTSAERNLGSLLIASAAPAGPIATRAKALGIRGRVMGGKFTHNGDETMQMVPDWPDNLSEHDCKKVESSLRAMFMALTALDADKASELRAHWVRDFWRSNWRIFPCYERDDRVAHDRDEIAERIEILDSRMGEVWDRFIAISRQTDPDLFEPDRWEVLTGITARALRIVAASIRSPDRWSLEHVASDLRSLTEAIIVARWLEHKADPALYTRFKDFGRGKLKLLKLHWEDFAETLDEVPPAVEAQIDELQRLVEQDIDEDFQNINLGGNFAGIDTRKMAAAVGMESEYKLAFAPASSGTHGEWGHLDRYVLVRCVNPTHGFHRIPRSAPGVDKIVPETARDLINAVEQLVDLYEEAAKQDFGATVDTPPNSVD